MQKPSLNRLTEILVVSVFAVPLLGLLMGGVYSLPAMKLTKERDPWLTVILGLGLAVTVFGIGTVTRSSTSHLVIVWAASLFLLLLARKFYGGLGHSLERFGVVHLATLLMTFFAAVAAKVGLRSVH
jgi:hypothetical protein